MIAAFQEILNSYLVPFALAVPLALLVLLIVVLKGGDAPPSSNPQTASPGTPGYAPTAPAPMRDDGQASVLVVDDSAVARAKLRKLFEGAGYEVEVSGDGAEALEQLARRRFSVLITDLEMPTMDGFELIAAVQGSLATEDLPIIAITGHDELQARVTDVRGLYGIFKKPWSDRELLKRVGMLASLRPAAAA